MGNGFRKKKTFFVRVAILVFVALLCMGFLVTRDLLNTGLFVFFSSFHRVDARGIVTERNHLPLTHFVTATSN